MKSGIKFLSFILLVVGLGLLLNAGLPIVQYEITALLKFQKVELLSPLVETSPEIPGEVAGVATQAYPIQLTDANRWFEGEPELPQMDSKVTFYNLSVPRLKIQDAVVEIGGNDLAKNLIHYKGTALPGREGNAVIFGHSSLPQFFSPKNYLSIFAKLPTLKQDDTVIVNYDGITYTFKVTEMFEVKPTDVQVLAQRYDGSYLTLVTCVPPGTYLKRLIVIAKLVPTS